MEQQNAAIESLAFNTTDVWLQEEEGKMQHLPSCRLQCVQYAQAIIALPTCHLLRC
jgi:hypothetical protein